MADTRASVEIIREYELFKRRENTQPHMSYANEKERHRVISGGRMDLLDTVLALPPDGTEGVLSDNELRNRKNMFISAITLFTRAAMDGGLPEEIAYAMSDSYIQNGEKAVSTDEIHSLYVDAYRQFTAAVAEKGNRHYSSKIEAVIHYIHVHLHEPVTLEDVAEHAKLSPCYVSRLFKAETGMSIVDYIQKERVGAAKHMLIYSDFTLAAISQYLCFSTQSYFIKIFKKYEGVTPAQYRKYYRENEKW